jgi:uncharacterized protein YndB with AHSA1/START domain
MSTSTRASRRDFIAGVSVGIGSLSIPAARAGEAAEISHRSDAVHQEIEFSAPPQRVYAALTEAVQFQKAMMQSAAVTSGMVKSPAPAQISRKVGGAFVLFGGVISGRIIELVPDQRIVQAWRAADWPAGVYSIARFELQQHGTGTRLVFDHTGFPNGAAQHLADGWKANYWEPLKKVL